MRTGAVLTIEVDRHVKDSPLDIVRLFTLKNELLCDSVHTASSGAVKIPHNSASVKLYFNCLHSIIAHYTTAQVKDFSFCF